MNSSWTVQEADRAEPLAPAMGVSRATHAAYLGRARDRAARLLSGLAALTAAGASGEPAWSEEARLARAGGERPEWWRSRPPGA